MGGALEDKTALITGSTQGIGYAIADEMLARGATVLVHGRDPVKTKRAAARLGGGGRVHPIVGDLASAEGCDEVLYELHFYGHDVDILINNAGQIERSHGDAEYDDYARLVQVNAVAGLRLARALLPRMIAENNHGRVIWISSETALIPPPDMGPYAVSKAAQLIMSRLLAEQAAGTTVTSLAVLVGPTKTEGAQALVGDQWDQVMAAHPASLLKRPTTPREIAQVVAYLATPASTAIRGSALRLDGGGIPTIV
ncbi:SDR family NAD(P)-dependent oxidoreductase [Streptomyces sp. TRM70350]|uniref:SDR family NAD(P)-dependent oxidoreductase n=1 Tax=Streptomyces sp. TRM70350 TaxID=2856165 RepID=UPI001C446432|nr:SDR family oxidoreductase [Streptomyces sp. TRM70350]MBV7697642.1 SDR family oxidoreductase [Streptomyces sp. TRM70350]